MLALAWAYVAYGDTPSGEALLYGVKPVIVAIVLGRSSDSDARC